MAKVNYDLMRVRLEFLYRTMNRGNMIMQQFLGASPNEIEQTQSVVASAGLQVLYMYRIEGEFIDSPAEKRSAEAIARFIADEFMRLSESINRECSGLPISLLITRYEIMVQGGIDKILEQVKGLIEGKEVSNG